MRRLGSGRAPVVPVGVAKLPQPGQVLPQVIGDGDAFTKRVNLGLALHRHFKEMLDFSVRLPQLATKVHNLAFRRQDARFQPLQFGLAVQIFALFEAWETLGFP